MTEPSDTLDIAQLPDEEDQLYIIGIDSAHSSRYMERLAERFEEIFDNATYIVVGGKVASEADVTVSMIERSSIEELPIEQVDKESVREAYLEAIEEDEDDD